MWSLCYYCSCLDHNSRSDCWYLTCLRGPYLSQGKISGGSVLKTEKNPFWLIQINAAVLQVIKFPTWKRDAPINGGDTTLGRLPTPVIVIGYWWEVCVSFAVKLSVKWHHVHVKQSKVLLEFILIVHSNKHITVPILDLLDTLSPIEIHTHHPKHPHTNNKFAVREADRESRSSNRQEIGMLLRRWWRREERSCLDYCHVASL